MRGNVGQSGILRLAVHMVAAILLIVGGAVYYLAIIRPQCTARKEHFAEIQRLVSLQETALGADETEQKLRDELAVLKQQDAQLRARIPADAQEHTFLNRLNEVVGDLGVQLIDYQRQGIADEPNYSTLRVNVRCRGDYAGMCRLIDRLQTFQRLVVVEHLAVTSDMLSAEHDYILTLVLPYGLRSKVATEEVQDV